jgi:hypothetical protein
LFFFFWGTDKNYIKDSVKLTGKKRNSISKRLDVGALKKVGAASGATLNDVVLALVGVSIKQYLVSNKDFNTTSLNTLVPFSLRTLPRTVAEHRLENDFSVLCFDLPLRETFAESIKATCLTTKPLKKSLYPFGVLALTELIAWFPSIIG